MKRLLLLPVLAALGCGEEPIVQMPDREVCLERRDGNRYCIDVFEASRSDATSTSAGVDDEGRTVSLPDRLPWTEVTWLTARDACARKSKRLCRLDEWLDACDGVVGEEGRTFVYGDTADSSLCNTDGEPIEPGGSRTTCVALTGTLDQSGNVWEWTGETLGAAAARGGSFRSSQTHRCDSELPGASATDTNIEVGFRCCRDS